MKFKIRPLKLTTGGTFVAVLNKNDASILDLHSGNRVKIKINHKELISVIDLTDDEVSQGEIGLFEEVLLDLGIKKGYVDVSTAPKLNSVYYIKKKLDGFKLNKNEIDSIINDVVKNNLNEIELAYFVSGCYSRNLDKDEVTYLTKSILNHGVQLGLKDKIILDKHSIGGVPGNRTTMILVPIISALGYKIPKTSSRSITSPAGTADTMEVLASVSFSVDKIREIVNKTNGCIVWGGAVNLASADDRLIKVRNPLSLDPEGMLLASIIAKKAAVNSTHVLIDIPVGKGSKIENKKDALRLKNRFIMLGKDLGIKIKVIFTEGYEPIGNGIGPSLEAIDVLKVLKGTGPKDLRDKSLELASIMLKMIGEKNPLKKATEVLDSGLAYEKMKEIIKAQNGNPNIKTEDIEVGPYKYNVKSDRSGKVVFISDLNISKIARIAGAPVDKSAGIYLNVNLNDYINKNDNLFTIYYKSKEKLNYAVKFYEENDPILIK